MGYILKLPTAGAASLPTLGDIGYISKQNLRGLYLIDSGSGLADASGNGNTLVRTAGSFDPPYASGVLQFRKTNTQQLSTGITVAGANQTIIAAVKRVSTQSSAQIVFGHLGAVLAGSAFGPMTLIDEFPTPNATAQNFGLQSKRPQVNYATGALTNAWAVWMGVRDANGVSLSLNGQAPVTVAYTTPDPGTGTTNAVAIGDIPGAGGIRHLDADVGFFAVYDRALPAAEQVSAYKAIKRLMAAKGHVL